MKNALLIPLVFLLNLLALSVFISISITVGSYEAMLSLIDRNYYLFVTATVKNFFEFFPLIVMIALLMVLFYLMRHKTPFFLSIPLIISLFIVSAAILVPLSYRLSETYTLLYGEERDRLEKSVTTIFSPGLIRPDNASRKTVWFDDRFSGSRVVPLILLDSVGDTANNAMKVFPYAEYSAENHSLLWNGQVVSVNSGSRDPLIHMKTTEIPFLSFITERFSGVLRAFRDAAYTGVVPFFIICGSFFTAVLSLWFLCYLTSWKLLNLVMTSACFIFLFVLHPFAVETVSSIISRIEPFKSNAYLSQAAFYGFAAGFIAITGFFVALRRKITRPARSGQ